MSINWKFLNTLDPDFKPRDPPYPHGTILPHPQRGLAEGYCGLNQHVEYLENSLIKIVDDGTEKTDVVEEKESLSDG